MARSLASVSTNNFELQNATQNPPLFAIIDQWQVQYARFINYSSTNFTQTHPSLTLCLAAKRLRRGNWISAAGAASLKLIYEQSASGSDDAVLVVSIPPWLPEEHHISKMHFSWPHVSCVSGFPARGSRAIFVSYKDNADQIQKFALRFAAANEAEKFMNILKEILGNGNSKYLQCSEYKSELSSQAEVIPSYELTNRPEEDRQHTISADISIQPMIPIFDFNATKEIQSQERTQDVEAAEETMSTFPPSFTDLLKNCQPAVDDAIPNDSKEDLKTQFMQYLEGTSFKEILTTVENVINELGDDLLLF